MLSVGATDYIGVVSVGKECVMCGNRAVLTREHALPSWLGLLYDPSGNPEIRHRYEYPPEAGLPVREWTTRGFDLKVKSVCAGCNTGWMSRLEQDARSLLTSMSAAERITLIHGQCRLLTQWYAKTIVMLDLVHPAEHRLIYETLIDSVRRRAPPSRGFGLWAGFAKRPSGAATGAQAMTVQTGKQRPHDVRLSALVLKQLLLVGMSHDDDRPADASYMNIALTPIWPPKPIVSFPPHDSLNQHQVSLVLHMLAACIRWPEVCQRTQRSPHFPAVSTSPALQVLRSIS